MLCKEREFLVEYGIKIGLKHKKKITQQEYYFPTWVKEELEEEMD